MRSLKSSSFLRFNSRSIASTCMVKVKEDTPFSDMHAGPSTPADHNEIIPNIGSNDRDAYAEARANISKELTQIS